ncbi:unnamed protein product [Caenorhabditis bovis]|uniref:COMM domain-containing protein n=1 Tax=Caenorhabditis bovis TaxID=2654633 RepID=A0A8S1EKP8_9PELO|nr:unnamed protein product [Caenorhabditis bovis]
MEDALKFISTAEVDEGFADEAARKLLLSGEGNDQKTRIIWKLLVLGARKSMSVEEFRALLGASTSAESIGNAFEKYREKIIENLKTIRWEYDDLMDVDWSVAKVHQSSLLGSNAEGEMQASFCLKTAPAGGLATRTIDVTFDDTQLHAFLYNLKEAQNMMEASRK